MLRLISKHGRACLMIGLAMGLALPRLAAAMAPWLPEMVAVLLTLTALRIGHRAATGAVRDLRWGLAAVVVLQTMVPATLLGVLALFGLHHTPGALAAVLVSSAPAITGSVNLTLMMRMDAGRMMQILILGTALFPLTILPVMLLLPQLGSVTLIAAAAFRLLVVVVIATGLGFVIRAVVFPRPNARQIEALDGLSVLAFAVIAIALIAPLNPTLRSDPWSVLNWTLLAFAVSYLLQLTTLLTLRRTALRAVAGPLAIGAGTRNIALFLIALPPEVMGPLMIFVATWQLPMYLTPMLLPRLYQRLLRDE